MAGSNYTLAGEIDLQSDSQRYWSVLEKPSHPDLLKLNEIWQSCNIWRSCTDEVGFVVGRDVPSRHLAGMLHNLMVWEPDAECRDFVVRLAGGALRRRYGRDITGERASQIYRPEELEILAADFQEALRSNAPVFRCRRIVKYGVKVAFDGEVGIFPVLSSDRSAKWFLIGLFEVTA